MGSKRRAEVTSAIQGAVRSAGSLVVAALAIAGVAALLATLALVVAVKHA